MALKIIHTADWHLGQTFFGYDREAEQQAFLGWLIEMLATLRADVLLIAGDVFDVSNPSASAQRRFFRFLKEAVTRNPSLQIVVIAGNHDSAARLEAPNPLLEELNTYITGVIGRTESGEIDFDSLLVPLRNKTGETEAWCMTVPYLRQGDYPATDETPDTYIAGVARMYNRLYSHALEKRLPGQAILAMGHLHASGAELSDNDRSERIIMGGLESVPANTFASGIAYTALGHIHKAQRVGGREEVRYSGSPLPMSFSEKGYNHQVIYLETEGETVVKIEPVAIPRKVDLLRIPATPLSTEEVIRELEKLPENELSDILPPFLEVRVLLTEPEPSFRHRVEEALLTKQVRLTSIVPSYLRKDALDKEQALSLNDLRKIEPLEMLKRAFSGKYNTEMPAEMEALFNEVLSELNLQAHDK